MLANPAVERCAGPFGERRLEAFLRPARRTPQGIRVTSHGRHELGMQDRDADQSEPVHVCSFGVW
jgi:hypothetical protein